MMNAKLLRIHKHSDEFCCLFDKYCPERAMLLIEYTMGMDGWMDGWMDGLID